MSTAAREVYLTFAETDLDGVWACHVLREATTDHGADALVVRVEPTLTYASRDGKTHQVDRAVLVARHAGATVRSLESAPVYVYVLSSCTADAAGREPIPAKELTIDFWAELHPDRESAAQAAAADAERRERIRVSRASEKVETLDLGKHWW
jgi:hypothetical protein